MTERLLVKNKLPVWLGKRTPSPNVPTTTGNRWIDGTAGGSLTDNQYGFFAITGVGNMEYSIEDCAVKIAATSATGRGRVMSAPFEVSTTKQNVNQYAFKLLPSTSYTFRFKAKGLGLLAASARAAIRTFGPQGTSISTFYATDLPAGDSEYQNFEVTFTTGATTAFAIIYMEILPAGAVASAFFKDFELDLTAGSARANSSNRSTASTRMTIRDMGTSLKFDALSEYVTLSGTIDDQLRASGKFTLDIYLTPQQIAAYAMPICLAGSGLGKIGIAITATGLIQGRITNGANAETNFTGTGRVIPGVSARLSLTFDGATARTYLNGVQVATQAYVGLTIASGQLDRIGVRPSAFDQYFGLIHEARIWDIDLSADELFNLHRNNFSLRDNLIGEYLLNEAAGTDVFDTSGNGNHGVITGAGFVTDVPLKLRTIV